MKTDSARIEDHQYRRATVRTAVIGLSVVLLSFGLLASSATASSFNNVQILVTTSSNLPYTYTFTAYNLTGTLLGSYQGPYPAGAFELPTGDYLFTVSALYQAYGPCFECGYASAGVPAQAGPAAGLPALRYFPQASEYGYLVAHVSSSESLSVSTKNVTQFPTTQVSIKVAYVNGTAASEASVSASVVGQWYYWWGQDAKVVMWAQTGSEGVANLVLPVAPTVVTAWKWVAVELPPSQTTVVKDVGGEKINVTVYWQPSYVGLSGSTLIIPPASSAAITLHYKQPNYWVLPMGVQYAGASLGGASGATIANQPTGVPSLASQTGTGQPGQSEYYQPIQIPPLQAEGGVSPPSGSEGLTAGALTLTAVAEAVVIFGTLAVGIFALGRRQRSPQGT